jgi:hypothetical protein
MALMSEIKKGASVDSGPLERQFFGGWIPNDGVCDNDKGIRHDARANSVHGVADDHSSYHLLRGFDN